MEDEKDIDSKISRLVQAVDLDIPPELESGIREKAMELSSLPRRRVPSVPFWIVAASSATLLFLAFLLFSPKPHQQIEPVIPEIRTEFEIPDKNITIIYIQKSDFPRLEEI
jgi:hypothetical protein